MKQLRIHPQHDDQIHQTLGKHLTNMPIDDIPSQLQLRLNLVQQLVLIDDPRLQLVIVAFMAALFLYYLIDRQV